MSDTNHPDTGARREVKARSHAGIRSLAAALARHGVRPNTISWLSVLCATVAGCLSCGTACPALPRPAALLLSALFIQLRLLCNLLDGLVAVEGGLRTQSGEVFNDLPDRLSDSILFVLAGYGAGMSTLGWLAALLAMFTAYVRNLGAATGAGQFFLGPMAKQHRMALLTTAFVLAAVTADTGRDAAIIAAALAAIAAGSAITALRRALHIVRTLEAK